MIDQATNEQTPDISTAGERYMQFEVIVGNIGVVYRGDNRFDATVAYNTYVGQSKRGYGRAANESVILTSGDDEIKIHHGNQEI